jgi:hypothetical protein
MAGDKDISGLPVGTLPLSGGEPVPVVQAGVTVQVPSAAFGVPVASLVFENQTSDLGPVAVITPEVDTTYLLCMTMLSLDPAMGAGVVDITFTWVDPSGDRNYSPGGVDLSVDAALPEVSVLRVSAGTTVDFECENSGLYKSASYSLWVVLVKLQ